MCFSATASFSAAGVLGVIGLLSLRQIRGHNNYAAIAAVPLLFAFQQASEGVVWLTMGNPELRSLHVTAIYIFLFFAMCVWPTWVPLSVWLSEPQHDKKKLVAVITGIGSLITLASVYLLLRNPLHAQVFNCSIWYNSAGKDLATGPLAVAIYAFAVLAPLFISSLPRARLFAGAVLGSCIFTYVWMNTVFTSVWCFFAAILSAMIYWSLREKFPS
jgi:hypothetical protein